MRSHTLARALLRSAARSSSTAAVAPPARAVSQKLAVASASSTALRTFSTSPVSFKKKNKKSAFSAVEEDFEVQEDEFAIEEDDLFGDISSSTSATSSSSSSPTVSSMSRVEFATALSAYRDSLSWDLLDRGQFPPQSRWRNLASNATTQAELEELLELAKMYRDRVRSLGVESGKRFASRASRIRLPEIALNAFLDRYTYGLEYDLESLYLVQRGLNAKLNSGREELLASAELPGAPVQEADLLGVVPSDAAAEPTTEGEGEGEGDGKAEAIQTKHQLDMQLARAKLSLIDRMSLLASLSATPTTPPNPILVAYITRAYIHTFNLTNSKSASNPLLANVYARVDSLISLLTTSAQQSLMDNSTSVPTGVPKQSDALPAARSESLHKTLASTLSYVAVRGQGNFEDPLTNRKLDPVRVLYRYMDKVGPSKSNDLVRRVEPLLQSSRPL